MLCALLGTPVSDPENWNISFFIPTKEENNRVAFIAESSSSQKCCGFFLRPEFLHAFKLSTDTINRLNINLKWVIEFLTQLGFKMKFSGYFHKEQPTPLQPGDKILLYCNKGLLHCAYFCESSSNEHIQMIAHKPGLGRPMIETWAELHDFYLKKLNLELGKEYLTYEIYRRPTAAEDEQACSLLTSLEKPDQNLQEPETISNPSEESELFE